MKTALFLIRRPPFAGLKARELADSLFVAAAFEVPLRVLFLDAGVWQLAPGQQADRFGLTSVVKQLSALPLYDVTDLYADHGALQRFGLAPQSLTLPVTALAPAAIHSLIAGSELIFSD